MASSCCTRPPSTSPDNPRLIGEPDGVVTHARITVHAYRMFVGEEGWFTGAGVPVAVAKRILVLL